MWNILTLDRAINQGMYQQVGVKEKYNQDTDGLNQLEWESVRDKMPKWEPAADRRLWALSDPQLSNPSQDEKEVLLWSEEHVAVCPRLQLTSHTQPTSTLLRITCERYFYKEACSFIHWSSHYCWLCFCIYLYMYVGIQHLLGYLFP